MAIPWVFTTCAGSVGSCISRWSSSEVAASALASAARCSSVFATQIMPISRANASAASITTIITAAKTAMAPRLEFLRRGKATVALERNLAIAILRKDCNFGGLAGSLGELHGFAPRPHDRFALIDLQRRNVDFKP